MNKTLLKYEKKKKKTYVQTIEKINFMMINVNKPSCN